MGECIIIVGMAAVILAIWIVKFSKLFIQIFDKDNLAALRKEDAERDARIAEFERQVLLNREERRRKGLRHG